MIEQKRFSAGETDRQESVMSGLSQKMAAKLLGINVRTLRDHQAPRNPDGTYNGIELINWFIELKSQKGNPARRELALDRQAEAKAIKLEEEAKGCQGKYMLTSDRDIEFMEITSATRSDFESLPNTMANSYPADLRDQLTQELDNEVRQRLRRLAGRGRQIGVEE